jgi:hypothetical protein
MYTCMNMYIYIAVCPKSAYVPRYISMMFLYVHMYVYTYTCTVMCILVYVYALWYMCRARVCHRKFYTKAQAYANNYIYKCVVMLGAFISLMTHFWLHLHSFRYKQLPRAKNTIHVLCWMHVLVWWLIFWLRLHSFRSRQLSRAKKSI